MLCSVVFVGGVIDYLCAEVLEQAGYLGTLKGNPSGSRVIQPIHLQLVFSQDQEWVKSNRRRGTAPMNFI